MHKATGPDNISARFLKESSDIITLILMIVKRQVLHQFSRKEIEINYHPISLSIISVTCKIVVHVLTVILLLFCMI